LLSGRDPPLSVAVFITAVEFALIPETASVDILLSREYGGSE
jgi:hypothetical protein